MKKFSPRHHIPRYSRALFQTIQAPTILFFALVGNSILILCIALFYHFESGLNPGLRSFFDAIWWGMATVTTVGYGDIVPVTMAGRVIAMALMVMGVSFFVGFTALFVTNFMALEAEAGESELQQVLRRLDRMEEELRELRKK